MAKFFLAFRGGKPSSPEGFERMGEAWMGWMSALGGALSEKGAGFGMSRFLTAPDREEACAEPLSGYSIVEAADIEAALDLARSNPIFEFGGTIEVIPAMEMVEHG